MRYVLTLFWAFLAWSCSSDKHAGNASETTNHIAGVLELSEGSPAASARVTLYRLNGKPDSATKVDEQYTTEKGVFHFENLDSGKYALDAVHTESGTRWLKTQLESMPDSSPFKVQGVLAPMAWLHVATQNIPDSLGFEWTLVCNDVLSIPIRSATDTLVSLPSGWSQLRIQVANRSKGVASIWAADTLNLKESDTTELGTLVPWTSAQLGASPFLLDDFEDGNLWAPFESAWWLFSDLNNGGTSLIAYADQDSIGVDSPGYNSTAAAHFRFRFGGNAPTFVGFGINPMNYKEERLIDLSAIDTVSFVLKGSGAARIELCSSSSLIEKGTPSCATVTDVMPTNWTEYRIAWTGVKNNGSAANILLAKDLTLMLTPIADGSDSGELWVDDFRWNTIGQFK